MKTLGVVSYNIHCNITNYGSALQSWALNQVVGRLGYKADTDRLSPGYVCG